MCVQLAEIYKPKNAPPGTDGFGSHMIGREEVAQALAQHADKLFVASLDESTRRVKEKFPQAVCVAGVGAGKTRFICSGLQAMQQHCEDEGLRALLKAENFPLPVHITFNSDTPYGGAWEENMELAVSRRIICAVTGMSWAQARLLSLSDKLKIPECLAAVTTYHKYTHHLPSDSQCLVYLAVDEVNKLIDRTQKSSDIALAPLRSLVHALKGLYTPAFHVVSLMAGTHYSDMKTGFLGSGVVQLELPLFHLSPAQIAVALQDAGVNKAYLEDEEFRSLLIDIGPILRAVGVAVAALQFQYCKDSIRNARHAAYQYLHGKEETLSAQDVEALLQSTFAGLCCDRNHLLHPASAYTLDALESAGTVQLVAAPDDGLVQVYIPLLTMKVWLSRHPSVIAEFAEQLLRYSLTCGADAFEKFVALFHAVKLDVLRQRDVPGTRIVDGQRRVPLRFFYSGAFLSEDLRRVSLLLRTDVRFSPDDVVLWHKGKRFPESEAPQILQDYITSGGVMVNSKGAGVDVLFSSEIVDDGALAEVTVQRAVFAVAAKHTIDETVLSISDIEEDTTKAAAKVRSSAAYASTALIVAHVSNRVAPTDQLLREKYKSRTVVVGATRLSGLVGPVLGRLLADRSLYTSRVRQFSTLSCCGRYGALPNMAPPFGLLRNLWGTVAKAVKFF